MNKLWARSKTVWFGFAVVLLSIAELAQAHLPVLLADVAPKTNAWTTLAIGVLVIVLRFVTNTGVTVMGTRGGNGS